MVDSANKMRVTLVTLGSILATGAVVANAFYLKKQFYPSVVYLTKSNPSIAVLYAQAFVLVFLFGKAMRKIFFGQLRAAEIEHLIEKFWYVITETCLAFTVFRDDFSPKFVALFTFLLFMKAFHWLVEDRVDYMERSPIITILFHLRVISLLTLLGTVDSILIHHAFRTTITSGASVQMVFGFEYAILLVMVVAIIMKYILHTIDYMSEHPWDNKNVYLLYAELVTGFVKCCLYIAFVGVMVKIHTFPLFAIRPMYLTIRAFKKSLSDVILSRRAIAYMNTRWQEYVAFSRKKVLHKTLTSKIRFADATEEELQRVDNTCIICREQMAEGKKLPCNHIFHTHCLRSWFQRQQSCPTCRMDVLSARPQQTTTPVAPPQQQQQQPPQPGMPPHGPPFMGMPPPVGPGSPFGMPPMAPPPMSPPQQPTPQQPTPTPDGTQQQQQASTSTTGATSPTSNMPPVFSFPLPTSPPFTMGTQPPSMPFFTSPPPFMSMPPPPIFSPPNIDLSSLSMEQLEQMEGQERENVEARVKLLRNVHSLLDTVVIQLNQYSQAINGINQMAAANRQPPTNTATAATSSQSNTTINKANTEPTTNKTKTTFYNPEDIPGPSTRNIETPVTLSGDASVENVEQADLSGNQAEETNIDNENHPFIIRNDSSDNELRRRRLEKFQNLKKDSEVANNTSAEQQDANEDS